MKKKLMPEQQEWLDAQMEKQCKVEPNPVVRLYGKGPEDRRCKACAFLFVKQYAHRYYKCSLRQHTNGPGTDHRANWKACSKFSPKIVPTEVVHPNG